jgi:hypothetical protein
VFENRVLREVFGLKEEEMLNEELYDLCCSVSIIRMVGWAVHVARMREKRVAYRLLVGNLKKEEDNWEDLIVNGR